MGKGDPAVIVLLGAILFVLFLILFKLSVT